MKWLAIFDRLEHVHLNKDVGLLPMALADLPTVEKVTLLTQEGAPSTVEKAGKVTIKKTKNIWVYLLLNSTKYDVLHLFHLKWETAFRALLFKITHPRAKVYIKLDADYRIQDQLSRKKGWLRKPRVPDLIYWLASKLSVETQEIYQYLLDHGWSPKKLILLPNGVDRTLLQQAQRLKNKQARKKVILTVGRIGSFQKNTESLIRAYLLLPEQIRREWSLELVGPIEMGSIDALKTLAGHPNDNNITFVGSVDSREQLYEIYAQSSIFAFPSRWESSGLSLIEAMAFDLMIVSTPVGCTLDLITNGRNGFICAIDDDIDLSNKLAAAIDTVQMSTSSVPLTNSVTHLCWDQIAVKLKACFDE